MLDTVREELSSFYHSINNPLTILSGNLQFVQAMASSMELPADFVRSIDDLAGICGRFERDLARIKALREKIHTFTLNGEAITADN